MELKNYDALVDELVDMLRDFDKQLNGYQTDVYLYYDPETQTGKLDTFVNVGGNSWLDDDHVTIYRDQEHFDDIFTMYYQNEQEIADVLEITVDQLIEEAYKWRGWDEDDYYDISDVEYWDIVEYCQSQNDYMEALQDDYEHYIDHNNEDFYYTTAEDALDRGLEDWEYYIGSHYDDEKE